MNDKINTIPKALSGAARLHKSAEKPLYVVFSRALDKDIPALSQRAKEAFIQMDEGKAESAWGLKRQ